MLEHAIEQACAGRQILVVGLDYNHSRTLSKRLDELVAKTTIPKLRRESGRAVLKKRVDITSFDNIRDYDHESGSLAGITDRMELLIDHYVMEHRLVRIHRYIKACSSSDHVAWMAQTTKALSALGRLIYLVTDCEETKRALTESLGNVYQYGSIEDPEKLGLNWPDLSFRHKANPNCQLIFDPTMLERRFAAASKTITRWD